MTESLLESALRYARLGWHIFPCRPREKRPATKHGVKDATTNETQIKKWWAENSSYNIAVACGKQSGIYVVDVDVDLDKGINGWKSLEEFPEIPRTVQQLTSGSGAHFFFATDNPPANRNSFRPGIDIRGEGYYVVLSPSVHPNGGIYTWNPGCAPWELVPAGFPDFMRPAKKAPWAAAPTCHISDDTLQLAGRFQRASLYLAQVDPAIQGQGGHDKLLWAAVALVHGFLLSDGQALNLLETEYNHRCIPPWDFSIPADVKDFRRKVTEARKLIPVEPLGWLLQDKTYGPVDPAQVTAAANMLVRHKEKEASPQVAAVADMMERLKGKMKPLGPNEPLGISYWIQKSGVKIDEELEHLSHPPGLLGEICEWINETSLRPQPLLSLACTLTFCGVLFGRKIRDSLDTRTNLYCFGIADSSAGKAHAPNQIRNLAYAAGCNELIGGDDAASDAGIESRLDRNPACLFLWDEIGFILRHIKSGISQHHVRIIPQLMKLWSAGGSIFKGREYAEAENQRTIVQPCCSIYGTSTPIQFTPGISPEQLQDGFLARCLFFIVNSRPGKDREKCDTPPPECILKQVSEWYARQIREEDSRDISAFATYNSTSGTAIESPPKQIIIPRDKEAEKIFIAFDEESSDFGKANPLLDCLWSKAEENARRVSLIIAAGEDFDSPCVSASNADYSCRLVRYLLLKFGKDIVPEIVSCQIELQKRRLASTIKDKGVDGCSKRDITRASQWLNKKQRDILLEDLREAQEIVIEMNGKAVCYWTEKNYRKFLKRQANDS